MTDATTELFDCHADTYRADVEQSIGLTGLDLDFFTRAKAILDVGCGPGVADELLAPRFRTLTAIDTRPELVAQAEARSPRADEAYDGHGFPFPDSVFYVTFHLRHASCPAAPIGLL